MTSKTVYAIVVLSIGVLSALLLQACFAPSSASVRYHAYYVDTPPPAPHQEEVPLPPSAEYAWIPGYWYWSGYEYVWVQGRYARPPAPGHVYVRSGWVASGSGYRFVSGYWAPYGYAPSYGYVHVYRRPVRGPTYRHYRRR